MPTDREMWIVQLLAGGLKNKEIAKRVGTTEHVIKNYLRVIYDKLGLWNRVEVALWYVHNYDRCDRQRAAKSGSIFTTDWAAESGAGGDYKLPSTFSGS